ncbi:conjugal transfer protein MobC [Bacteroides uniformis]|uniref:Conjugal transfer protein TraG n=1 Tax=Bacteroides uniformis TaxID=820 RepID=A0AA37JT95_BACUN|nr:conjugal transfer protein MobC [Bacteroides uniformis]GKH13591.1 conjugal transfer protein TraG [Bacteroides uniformis]GKH36930.1 conjugal transfer protein TraG [Bacteroides uniformis]
MQQEDDLRALAKIMDFGRAVSIFIMVIHVYVYCYPSMAAWQLTLDVIDRILLNFDRTTGIFGCILWTKLLAVLLLAISCMGTIGVKGEKITWHRIWAVLTAGAVLFFLNWWLLDLPFPHEAVTSLYVLTLTAGYLCLLMAGLWISRLYRHNLMEDVFNQENESFMQETRLIENEYSVNLPTRFRYAGKDNDGWINVVNPFRATIVLGTPGSGKSYAVVNNYIRQMISKGFSVYIYDYKFDDLSAIAYNTLLHNMDKYKVKPHFYVINFDDPHRSHRCNPINPEFMTDISDAYEASYTIMLNLNKTWIEKQGDFFVESPIILLASIIWYLKIYKNGIYCTFPHAVELLNKPYADLFMILTSYPELENYLSPFMDAWKGGAQDQLQGQIASAKIPLTRMISPQLYWVMTGNDFSLDINNPQEPKILCVGNNPDRQNIYSAALGLYNSRIVKLINKKGQLKSTVIIDELPTIYFRGLDNLIATARSNKVAVCLGFQDFSQLNRDYGEKESKVIQNTVGNIFSGQVVGETAKTLSERFGKILQQRQSVSINRQDVSTSVNTQLDSLIPASKIANLSQGTFVGSVSDNFGEKIDQKIFHAEIVVDHARVSAEEKAYRKIPVINEFRDKEGNDIMLQQIKRNYDRIKADAQAIVNEEMQRIKSDPELCERLGLKTGEETENEEDNEN